MSLRNKRVYPSEILHSVTKHVVGIDGGLTYKQWLVGQILPGVMAKIHPDNSTIIANKAIDIADKVIEKLEKL